LATRKKKRERKKWYVVTRGQEGSEHARGQRPFDTDFKVIVRRRKRRNIRRRRRKRRNKSEKKKEATRNNMKGNIENSTQIIKKSVQKY